MDKYKMKNNKRNVYALAAIGLGTLLMAFAVSRLPYNRYSSGMEGASVSYEVGRVEEVISETLEDSAYQKGLMTGQQTLGVRLLTGRHRGELVTSGNYLSTYSSVMISEGDFGMLVDETDAGLAVETGIGSISFDSKAVEGIGGTANRGDISVSIAKVEAASLTEAQRQAVGDRPVYDFSVGAGGKRVSELGGGQARISIPYTPREGEDTNAIIACFLDGRGEPQLMRGAYSEETGMVVFTIKHLSLYFIGYNKVVFEDASGGWYSDAVTFIAARGITTGTGGGRFEPDKAITRAQFIVMLMRAYDVEPDDDASDNFDDAGCAYYAGYLAAAKKMGIANGVGDNRFAPDREITRQDMFTLLYRSLTALAQMPEPVREMSVSDFSDASSVSDYAADALDTLIKCGIVDGGGKKLEPLSTSTRAQMAQVLYNLLKEAA